MTDKILRVFQKSIEHFEGTTISTYLGPLALVLPVYL